MYSLIFCQIQYNTYEYFQPPEEVFIYFNKTYTFWRMCTFFMKKTRNYRLNELKLMQIYAWITNRCKSERYVQFHNYWWRWIKNEWKSFDDFYNDMLPWYKPWLSIDRIDNDWNYCKKNCQWLTVSENSRKKNKKEIPDTPIIEVKKRPKDYLDDYFNDCWLHIKWNCTERRYWVISEVVSWIRIYTYWAPTLFNGE